MAHFIQKIIFCSGLCLFQFDRLVAFHHKQQGRQHQGCQYKNYKGAQKNNAAHLAVSVFCGNRDWNRNHNPAVRVHTHTLNQPCHTSQICDALVRRFIDNSILKLLQFPPGNARLIQNVVKIVSFKYLIGLRHLGAHYDETMNINYIRGAHSAVQGYCSHISVEPGIYRLYKAHVLHAVQNHSIQA